MAMQGTGAAEGHVTDALTNIFGVQAKSRGNVGCEVKILGVRERWRKKGKK